MADDRMTAHTADAQSIAQKCAYYMYERDEASQTLGIRIQTVSPGKCIVSMEVRQDMVNGLHTCHGGVVFSLADTAFAFACNSHNEATVAGSCTIDFILPVYVGDHLTASAETISQSTRIGTYLVKVTNQTDQLVAWFRGYAVRINRPVLPQE